MQTGKAQQVMNNSEGDDEVVGTNDLGRTMEEEFLNWNSMGGKERTLFFSVVGSETDMDPCRPQSSFHQSSGSSNAIQYHAQCPVPQLHYLGATDW